MKAACCLVQRRAPSAQSLVHATLHRLCRGVRTTSRAPGDRPRPLRRVGGETTTHVVHAHTCVQHGAGFLQYAWRAHTRRERERGGSDAPVAPVARIARVALAVVAARGAPSFAANIRLSRRRCAQHQAKGGLCEPLRVERRLERARAYRRDQPPRARQGRRDPRRRFTESDRRRCSRRAQGNGSARRSDRGWCRPCAYRHGCRTDVHGRC